ncbi:MAG: hypothetical protein WA777_20815 [Rhodanobacter sp.]
MFNTLNKQGNFSSVWVAMRYAPINCYAGDTPASFSPRECIGPSMPDEWLNCMIFCALLVMEIHALASGTNVAPFLCRKAFDKQGVSILLGERDE